MTDVSQQRSRGAVWARGLACVGRGKRGGEGGKEGGGHGGGVGFACVTQLQQLLCSCRGSLYRRPTGPGRADPCHPGSTPSSPPQQRCKHCSAPSPSPPAAAAASSSSSSPLPPPGLGAGAPSLLLLLSSSGASPSPSPSLPPPCRLLLLL